MNETNTNPAPTANEFQNTGVAAPVVTAPTVSEKNRVAAALLCFFLGAFGIHRFYAGKVGSGVVMLLLFILGWLTLGIVIGVVFLFVLGIWEIVDFIVILCGNFKDGNNLPIK